MLEGVAEMATINNTLELVGLLRDAAGYFRARLDLDYTAGFNEDDCAMLEELADILEFPDGEAVDENPQ